MAYEVHLGTDNEVAIILRENGTAVDISGATKIAIKIGKNLYESTNASSHVIHWNGATYATGEVHINLGASTVITPRICRAPIIVYDSTNTNGIMYGSIQLDIKANPGSTS